MDVGHCPVSPQIVVTLVRGMEAFLSLNHSLGEEEPQLAVADVCQGRHAVAPSKS